MSFTQHHATVDNKSLKMKIKRNKNESSTKPEPSKTDVTTVNTTDGTTGSTPVSTTTQPNNMSYKSKSLGPSGSSVTDKSLTKTKTHKKDKSAKDGLSKTSVSSEAGSVASASSLMINANVTSTGLDTPCAVEPKVGDHAGNKRDNLPVDPYEFNAKVEDASISMPMKKVKIDKITSNPSTYQTVATETCSVGVITEPECLGPCEPGTSVTLEGIVWHETEQGVLVINVTWRGKTYVGTLLDATKHDWAPPRLSCDSPVSDLELRTPKGRGKRGRTASNTPVNEKSVAESRKLRKTRRTGQSGLQVPSPAKSEQQGIKRKSRPPDLDSANSDSSKPSKKACSSRVATPNADAILSGLTLIECPEPNCNKKYKHINGLRYHQAHSHPQSALSISTDNILNLHLTKDDTEEGECNDDVGDSASNSPKATVKSKECPKPKSDTEFSLDADDDKSCSATSKVSLSADNESKAINVDKNDMDRASKSKNGTKPGSATKNKSLCKSIDAASTTPSSPFMSNVFQVTTAQMGSMSSIYSQSLISSVANSSSCTYTSSADAITSMNTLSTTVSIVTPNKAISEPIKDDKNSKNEKKTKNLSTRPIMPAPPTQILSLSNSVTHANVTPTTSHVQSSPSLKPIQPKPTIMGEPSSINPTLSSLKDKKPKVKKKKDKEKDAFNASKDDAGKSSLNKPLHSPQSDPSVSQTSKQDIAINSKRCISQSSNDVQISESAIKDSVQNELVINESKELEDEGGLSPAYSDISDVNENGSSHNHADTPSKTKASLKKNDKTESMSSNSNDENGQSNVSNFGLYPYYSPTQYVVPSENQLSPDDQKTPSGNNQYKSDASDKKKVESKRCETVKVPPKIDKDDTKIITNTPIPTHAALRSSPSSPTLPQTRHMPPTPQQIQHEYQQQQQKWMQHMYALQNMTMQYQYLASMGYPVDQNAAHHMGMLAQDPHFRQQQYDRSIDDRTKWAHMDPDQRYLMKPDRDSSEMQPKDMSRTSQILPSPRSQNLVLMSPGTSNKMTTDKKMDGSSIGRVPFTSYPSLVPQHRDSSNSSQVYLNFPSKPPEIKISRDKGDINKIIK